MSHHYIQQQMNIVKKIFILKQIKIHIKTLQHQAAACNCFDCKVTTKLSLTSKNCLWLHDDFETFRNITRIVKLPQWKFAFIVYSCDFCSTLWNLIDNVNFDRIYNKENSIVTFSSIHPHWSHFYCGPDNYGRALSRQLLFHGAAHWGVSLQVLKLQKDDNALLLSIRERDNGKIIRACDNEPGTMYEYHQCFESGETSLLVIKYEYHV